MDVFDIILKEDTAERLAKVQSLDPKYILFAPEFNAIVAALKKMIPKGQFRDNYEAYAAGLDDGDFYYLPVSENRNILAIYKAPSFISIVDNNRDLFEDLEGARAYILNYTNASPLLESYVNRTYRFSVPPNTSFNLANNFLSSVTNGQNVQFIDEGGVVNLFGDNAFLDNTKNNVIGNATFGIKGFKASTGNNHFGNIIAGDAFCAIASGTNTFNSVDLTQEAFIQSTGIFHFNYINLSGESNFRQASGQYFFHGNLGTTEGEDFSHDTFYGATGTVHALASKQTSNAGGIEGDLARAISQGLTVIFDL